MDESIVPEFNSWLEELVAGNGSDLHVKVGSPPMMRLAYGLVRLDRDPLSPIETQAIADGDHPRGPQGDLQGARRGRLRLLGRERRPVPCQRLPPAWVGLDGPQEAAVRRAVLRGDRAARRRCAPSRTSTAGLILVTGPTGSGKTTTLAAMIGYLNATKPVHIVTVEDPIEVLHKDELASINQREVGQDTPRLPVGAPGRAPPGPRRDLDR